MASCTAAAILLLYLLGIADLHQCAGAHRRLQVLSRKAEIEAGGLAEVLELGATDVFAFILGKSVEEDADLTGPVGDDGAETTGAACPRSRDALLDDDPAQIRVDPATFGSIDSVSEHRIVDPLTAREPGKGPGFEYPHSLLRRQY